jgi:hypothetical protein
MVAELVLVLGVAYALKEIYKTLVLPSEFYYITLQFLPYWARAGIFGILGVGLLLFSYLKLTQSVLGPFIPGNSTTSVIEVIHAFRLRGRGPRIVAIGGGTGLSALLRGLKIYTSNLSAIVTVADDGGSSGRLRDEYRILPPGDFRQCLIALADAEPLMKQLFDHASRRVHSTATRSGTFSSWQWPTSPETSSTPFASPARSSRSKARSSHRPFRT